MGRFMPCGSPIHGGGARRDLSRAATGAVRGLMRSPQLLTLAVALLTFSAGVARAACPFDLGNNCGGDFACCPGEGCALPHADPQCTEFCHSCGPLGWGRCCNPLCEVDGCCLKNGAAGTGTMCCSQQSTSGTCQCLADSAPCWDNDMCCSNLCSGTDGAMGTCQAAPLQHPCQQNQTYCSDVPGACECSGNKSDTACLGGECCSIVFGYCGSQGDCCPGNTCETSSYTCLISTGQGFCTVDNQCFSGTCDTTKNTCCAWADQACSTDSDCCQGWNGDVVTCSAGQCKIADGDSTLSAAWCLSGQEDSNGNCCGIVNDPCTGSGQSVCCSGNTCENGLCKINTGDQWCTQNGDCVSGSCCLNASCSTPENTCCVPENAGGCTANWVADKRGLVGNDCCNVHDFCVPAGEAGAGICAPIPFIGCCVSNAQCQGWALSPQVACGQYADYTGVSGYEGWPCSTAPSGDTSNNVCCIPSGQPNLIALGYPALTTCCSAAANGSLCK